MKKELTFTQTAEAIEGLTGSAKERAQDLLSKATFQSDQMEKLQEELKAEGWTEIYQNGATQTGTKKSIKADIYNSLSKTYLATMKQINEMLEEVDAEARLEDNALLRFIEGR